MARIFSCTFLLLAFLIFAFTPDVYSEEFLTYNDPRHGFNIQYSPDWKFTEFKEPRVYVIFTSPSDGINDDFYRNVLVLTEKQLIPITLDDYTEISIAQMGGTNFEILESSRTTLAGLPAHKIIFTGIDSSGTEFKQISMWTIKDDMVYIVAYTATTDTYDSFLPIAQKMIDSFEIYEREKQVPLEITFENFSTYQHPVDEISFQYPDDWTLVEPQDPRINAILTSPSEDEFDKVAENVIFVSEKLPLEQNLEDYSKIFLNQIGSSLPDYKELDYSSFTLAGNPAKTVTYSAKDPNYQVIDMKGKMVWTIKDGTSYAFLLSAENIKYSTYLPAFEKMIDSFFIGTTQEKTSTLEIPDWIRNNAKWWSEGTIRDSDFVGGIQHLIREGIISIPDLPESSESVEAIPDWIKYNAGWWADGLISDNDFVLGIKYMVENGIIKV